MLKNALKQPIDAFDVVQQYSDLSKIDWDILSDAKNTKTDVSPIKKKKRKKRKKGNLDIHLSCC